MMQLPAVSRHQGQVREHKETSILSLIPLLCLPSQRIDHSHPLPERQVPWCEDSSQFLEMGHGQASGMTHSTLSSTGSPPHHLNPSEQPLWLLLNLPTLSGIKADQYSLKIPDFTSLWGTGNRNNQEKSAVTLVKEWRSRLGCSSPSRCNMDNNLGTQFTTRKPQPWGSHLAASQLPIAIPAPPTGAPVCMEERQLIPSVSAWIPSTWNHERNRIVALCQWLVEWFVVQQEKVGSPE